MAAAFHHFFKDRVSVVYQFETSETQSVAEIVWYCVGIILDKQKCFIEDDSKGNTIISSEYVKVMVEGSNLEDVFTFESWVSDLQTKIGACNTIA